MFQKITLLFLILFVACGTLFGQSVMKGTVLGKKASIRFYRPFESFANEVIPETVTLDRHGHFEINFKQKAPAMVRLMVNNTGLDLFVEPGDTCDISLFLEPHGDSIHIAGPNAQGLQYYNRVYNAVPLEKFLNLRDVFAKNKDRPVAELFEEMRQAFNRETAWVDHLLQEEAVSPHFSRYYKAEIHARLVRETYRLCKHHFEGAISGEEAKRKSILLKQKIIGLIPPDNPALPHCLAAPGYYHYYYTDLFHRRSLRNTFEDIPDDFAPYALAPSTFAKYLMGHYLLVAREMVPGLYDYCALYQSYSNTYGNNEVTKYMEQLAVCDTTSKEEVELVEWTYETDFKELLKNRFAGQRLYIDIWATWCMPCKMEFRHYDRDFYDFLQQYDIENVFLSIDQQEKHELWKKQVASLNLKGYHLRTNPILTQSLQDLLFAEEGMSIPRYLIVNERGKIVVPDAERPGAVRQQLVSVFANEGN